MKNKPDLLTTSTANGTRYTAGKIGYAILWLLGVPLPILLLFYACSGNH